MPALTRWPLSSCPNHGIGCCPAAIDARGIRQTRRPLTSQTETSTSSATGSVNRRDVWHRNGLGVAISTPGRGVGSSGTPVVASLMNTHAAPAPELSKIPHTKAVSPSADSETERPWPAAPAAPVPTSFAPCWLHTPALRVNTQAAPAPALSLAPPTTAVFPSADSHTDPPWAVVLNAAVVPTSFAPCWPHTLPVRLYTQAAPSPESSRLPPTTAVFPSADSETDSPCSAAPTAPVPTSFAPCWLHTPAVRVNTHAAPAFALSTFPPTTAVFPSAESETEHPWFAMPTASAPTSFVPCCLQPLLLLVYTHTAPTPWLSKFPPTTAVFPSADSATASPCCANPTAPVPTSFVPCWLHTPALRVKIHAAPRLLLSPYPPTTAVFPSADSETDTPCSAVPTAPVPNSFAPCWLQTPALRVYTHVAPAPILSLAPPTIAVFPSADSETEYP